MAENNTTFSLGNATDVETAGLTLSSLYLIISLLVMFTNGIVMVVVVTSQELHLPTLWNIAFMALCDFSYGLDYLVFVVPLAFMKRFAYPDSFLAPVSMLQTLLFGQNVLNIAVATVDRYLSVCWPLKYPQLMSGKRFIIATIITIVINVCRLCLSVSPKVDMNYYPEFALCGSKFKTFTNALAAIGLPFATVVVIICFLVRLIIEMLGCRRRVHPATNQSSNQQFTVTICLSALVFCLSYFPTCINIIWSFMARKENFPLAFAKFGIICLLSNSLWNVIIYAATYRPFRDRVSTSVL